MFSKWIIFIILFAYAENSPETKPKSQNYDITNTLNDILSSIFRSFSWKSYVHVRDNTDNNLTSRIHNNDVQFRNGIKFQNITTKFQPSPNLKVRLMFSENITASCEMISVTLKGYVKNSSYYIATEIIPFNFTLNWPTLETRDDGKYPVIVDYLNFDQYNITLLTNGYKYKSNEEDEIRQDFKTFLRKVFDDKVNQDWKVSLIFLGFMFLRGLGQKNTIAWSHPDFLQNEQSHYYFVGTIPSADYTLSNVTIKGIWNFQSILLNFSSPNAFPELQMNDVTGTMVQNFPNGENPLELSLHADTIYTSANQEAGLVNFKAEGYSITNTKSKERLTRDQSRIIIERIQSAIEEKISIAVKNYKV